MNIKVNDLVKVVANRYYPGTVGSIGKVIRIHDFASPVAIVEFSKCTAKIPVEHLEKVEVKSEIPEGAKQITREDFAAALNAITNPEAVISEESDDRFRDLLEGLAALAFGLKLSRTLFKDSDEVILTEDDFVSALWDACNPADEVKRTPNVSAFDGLRVALASVVRLRGLNSFNFPNSISR